MTTVVYTITNYIIIASPFSYASTAIYGPTDRSAFGAGLKVRWSVAHLLRRSAAGRVYSVIAAPSLSDGSVSSHLHYHNVSNGHFIAVASAS